MPSLSHRVSLLLIVCASHIYSFFVFGAVFWIDSIHYVNLGESLLTKESLSNFYDGIGSWFFNHLQPGVPIVWIITSIFTESVRWPLMAILQHALACYSLYYCFLTLMTYWRSPIHFIVCAAISFLPFYQSLHGALLSESITSSFLLISFAQSLRNVKNPNFLKKEFFGVLFCLFCITQFRSYYGLIILAFSITILIKHKLIFTKYVLLCLMTALIALLFFPIYRYHATGKFLLPSGGMNVLLAGWWVNPFPSDEALRSFNELKFPHDISVDKLINKGIEYEKAIELGHYWRTQGLSDFEIIDLAEKFGTILRNDGYNVMINRFFLGLASTGAVLPYCLLKKTQWVFPGMTAQNMCEHQYRNFLYLSWIDEREHSKLFKAFFASTSETDNFALQAKSKRMIASATSPYLAETSIILRNPLLIGWITPDVWVIFAFIGLVFFAKKEKYVATLITFAIGINFFVTFNFPLGNVRYAYSLFPLYFVAISIALSGCWAYRRGTLSIDSNKLEPQSENDGRIL